MTYIMSSADLARFSNLRPFEVCEDAVAGTTSGIGHAIATELAAYGATIVLAGPGEVAEIEDFDLMPGVRYDNGGHYDDAEVSDPFKDLDIVAWIGCSFAADSLGDNGGTCHTASAHVAPSGTWDAIMSDEDRMLLPLQLHLPFSCV